MAYTISDLAELVEYRLIASAPDDDVAHSNLVQFVRQLELLAPRPLYCEVTWVFCDRCGCSVDTNLIHPDSRHCADDGDFLCADCWDMSRRIGSVGFDVRGHAHGESRRHTNREQRRWLRDAQLRQLGRKPFPRAVEQFFESAAW